MNIETAKFEEIATGCESRFQLWSKILASITAKSVLEIGVWKGEFAKHILKECEFVEQYYMIDPWAKLLAWNKPYNIDSVLFEDIYTEAMNNIEFTSSKVVVLRGATKDVIDKIPNGSLDFAYIDGDHTLRGITLDLIKLLPKIKENGLIGGDDFTNNPWQHSIRFEPTLVCPFSIYFAEAMDLPIVALPFNQFLIQNNQDALFSFTDHTGKYTDISLNKLPPRADKILLKKVRKGIDKIWH